MWRIILWVVAVGGLIVLILVGLFGAIYSWACWDEAKHIFKRKQKK